MVNKIFFCLIIFATTIGCSKDKANNLTAESLGLREGDLLFQDLDCGPMCDAIEGVTEGINGRDFSHCAMIVKHNDTLKVIEAIGNGVVINTLQHFLLRSNDTAQLNNTVICRYKGADEAFLSKASSFALNQLNKGYDSEFIMNNDKYYCSELLYDAFMFANDGNPVFELAPMTFKSPESNTFMPVWVDYYKELNKPIPEGEPGINPGLISRSNKLEVIE